MQSTSPTLLGYAVARPAFWHRRRTRIALIVAAAAMALAITGLMNRRFVESKVSLWEMRHRYFETAAETAPAARVVWESNPADVTSMTAGTTNSRYKLFIRPDTQQPVAVDWSDWFSFEIFYRREATTGWNQPVTGYREPVIFQHEVRTDAGSKALLVIQFATKTSRPPHLVATFLKRGTLTDYAYLYGPTNVFDDQPLLDGRQPLRLFAGQLDPKDDAHFTIRYELPKETGILDGHVESDPGAAPAYKEFGKVRLTRIPDPKPTPAWRSNGW